MESVKFSEIFNFKNKSNIKAGAGLDTGQYPFYTSSPVLSKYLYTYLHNEPGIIFGTGGNASVHYNERQFSTSTDCLVANLKPEFFNAFELKFIYYYLHGNIYILEQGFKGAGLKHISKEYIKNIDIPLFPKEYQIRVVKLLDLAQSLIEKRKQAIAYLDDYIKAVFLDMFGDPVSNPKGWKKNVFGNLCYRLSDGPFGSKLKTEHYSKSGMRVIRLQNIGIGEFKDSNKSFIKNSHYESELVNYTCQSGDVVIATLGDPNIRACKIPEHIKIAVNKADCIHCIPNETLNKDYLVALLNLPEFHVVFENYVHGQTRSRISVGQLKKIMIPVPPIDLQRKFSAIVEKCELMRAQMQSQLKELENNFQAELQRAFRGK